MESPSGSSGVGNSSGPTSGAGSFSDLCLAEVMSPECLSIDANGSNDAFRMDPHLKDLTVRTGPLRPEAGPDDLAPQAHNLRTVYNSPGYNLKDLKGPVLPVPAYSPLSPAGRKTSARTSDCAPYAAVMSPAAAGVRILYPTPYTLHPEPYTLHPEPYTLHPTPYTLHPSRRQHARRSSTRGRMTPSPKKRRLQSTRTRRERSAGLQTLNPNN